MFDIYIICDGGWGVTGLFNLRGNDIPYNPFFYSYTLLTLDQIWSVCFSEIKKKTKTFCHVQYNVV